MPLSINELSEISQRLNSIDPIEWNQIVIHLNRTQELIHFLTLIGHEEYHPFSNRTFFRTSGKILIVGSSQLQKKDIIDVCKKLKIREQRLEIVLEYKDNFNFEKTQYNSDYAAILVGPLPHMAKGVDGYTSIITKLEKADGYPPVIRLLNTSNELHISKQNIQNALIECMRNGIITI